MQTKLVGWKLPLTSENPKGPSCPHQYYIMSENGNFLTFCPKAVKANEMGKCPGLEMRAFLDFVNRQERRVFFLFNFIPLLANYVASTNCTDL